jgi:tetraacyldisaccharide 4'-kinase
MSLEETKRISDRLAQVRGTADCVSVAFPAERLMNASGASATIMSAAGRSVVAFCGIGNPEGFRQTLAGHTLNVRGFRAFPDHHHYTPADLDELARLVEESGASAVLTTLKDLVKINRDELAGRPLWAVHIETEIVAGGNLLENRLQALLAGTHRTNPA